MIISTDNSITEITTRAGEEDRGLTEQTDCDQVTQHLVLIENVGREPDDEIPKELETVTSETNECIFPEEVEQTDEAKKLGNEEGNEMLTENVNKESEIEKGELSNVADNVDTEESGNLGNEKENLSSDEVTQKEVDTDTAVDNTDKVDNLKESENKLDDSTFKKSLESPENMEENGEDDFQKESKIVEDESPEMKEVDCKENEEILEENYNVNIVNDGNLDSSKEVEATEKIEDKTLVDCGKVDNEGNKYSDDNLKASTKKDNDIPKESEIPSESDNLAQEDVKSEDSDENEVIENKAKTDPENVDVTAEINPVQLESSKDETTREDVKSNSSDGHLETMNVENSGEQLNSPTKEMIQEEVDSSKAENILEVDRNGDKELKGETSSDPENPEAKDESNQMNEDAALESSGKEKVEDCPQVKTTEESPTLVATKDETKKSEVIDTKDNLVTEKVANSECSQEVTEENIPAMIENSEFNGNIEQLNNK